MSEHGTEPRSVLLLDEMSDGEVGEHCDRLMRVAESPRRAELVVSFADDATDRIDFSTVSSGRQPAKRGFVTVGETMQAAGAGEPDFGDPIVEQAVANSSNLQVLGQTISRFCQIWSDTGYDIVVCFDSLTDLLASNDPEVVFQFCHVLSGRMNSVGAVAHFHLDPNEHSQQLQLTFEQIFDETLVEEIDVEHLVPTRRSRASDDDVAREADTIELDDPNDSSPSLDGGTADAETPGSGLADSNPNDAVDAATDAVSQTTGSGEASDDDIADALPD